VAPFSPGQGDQDLDPRFVNPSLDDYHLQDNSPCIASGRNGDDRGALPSDIVGIAEIRSLPDELALFNNYPNPFNASTIINYDLPHAAQVTLAVYDLLGRQIEILVDSHRPAGSHSITWHAENQPSGIYFYRLIAGETIFTKKLTILK